MPTTSPGRSSTRPRKSPTKRCTDWSSLPRRKDIATLYRGQQLVLFGHYRGNGEASLRLKGAIPGKPVSYETRFVFPDTADRNP